jgi:tryptophan synthase alpha chain
MSAIDELFRTLRAAGRKAFMPFVTAGDPDLAFTAEVLPELAASGCHLCELGIPYSDPIADGPVIQSSYTRALHNKIKLRDIFAMLRQTVPQLAHRAPPGAVPMPVVLMVSYAIVYRHGLQRFVDEAQAAGAAGAIVPDLPVEESSELAAICRRADFSLIQLVTPTTPPQRAVRIAEASSGFLYYVSVTGITGERQELPPQLLESVAWLRQQTELPICIGFGISQVEHVRRLAPVADGLIVGSAIVRRIAQAGSQPRQAVLRDVAEFALAMRQALDSPATNPGN